MKHAISLILETDTIEWIKRVSQNLSRQRNREVSKSEAVEYIVMKHWKKTLVRQQEKRHELREDRKYAEKKFGIITKPGRVA